MPSKGEKLENLMNCSDRLSDRLDIAFSNYQSDSPPEVRELHWQRVQALYKASIRVSKKMADLLSV